MPRKLKASPPELVPVAAGPIDDAGTVAIVPMVMEMPPEFEQVEKTMAAVRKEHKDVTWDLTTDDGLAVAKAARQKLRKLRTTVEAARERAKAPALTFGRNVDAGAARLTQMISEYEDPLAAKIKARDAEIAEAARLAEAAETARVSGLQRSLDLMRRRPHLGATEADVMALIDALPPAIDREQWQEFTATATTTLAEARGALGTALGYLQREAEARRQREQEAEELARLRKESADREAEAQRQAAAEAARATAEALAAADVEVQAPEALAAPEAPAPTPPTVLPPRPAQPARGASRNLEMPLVTRPEPAAPDADRRVMPEAATIKRDLAPGPKMPPRPAVPAQRVNGRLSVEVWIDCPVCGSNTDLVAVEMGDGEHQLLDKITAWELQSVDLEYRCPDCGAELVLDDVVW